jgi:hypothetical protein
MGRVTNKQVETYRLIFRYLHEFHTIPEIADKFGVTGSYVRLTISRFSRKGLIVKRDKKPAKLMRYKVLSTEEEFCTASEIPFYRLDNPSPSDIQKTGYVRPSRGIGKQYAGREPVRPREYWFILTRY